MRTHSDIARVCIRATAWRYPLFLSVVFVFAPPVFHVGRVFALRGACVVLLACARKTACAHKRARNISVLANLLTFKQFSHNSYAQKRWSGPPKLCQRITELRVGVVVNYYCGAYFCCPRCPLARKSACASKRARKFPVLANLPKFN